MTPPWQDRRIVAAAIAVVLALGIGLFWILRPAPEDEIAVVDTPPPLSVDAPELRPYQLYFPGADERLHAETRELAPRPEPTENVTQLVEALLAGPSDEGLWPPLPEGVTLGRAYLVADMEEAVDDVTVVLDLVTADGVRPSTGSMNELLMLYSLVNTVLLNVEEADRVVLLWNGRQSNTFAGHVDTTRPLGPAADLIARR